MNNIPNLFSQAALSSGQTALPEAQISSDERQQAIHARESLDTGLTIKTREGDVITLASSSYSQLDAYGYNSKGVIQNDQGMAVVQQNYREITLSSGQSFSFSVVGDLDKNELKDIESIIKDIDKVVNKMTHGHMDDALAQAMSMGGYDTVLEYSADISYEKSYAMYSQTRSQTITPLSESLLDGPSQGLEPFKENIPAENKNFIKHMDSLFEKMAKKLKKHEDKLLGLAKEPINRLFEHHLEMAKKDKKNHPAAFDAINKFGKRFEKLMEQLTDPVNTVI